jgi:hypothetical protein
MVMQKKVKKEIPNLELSIVKEKCLFLYLTENFDF